MLIVMLFTLFVVGVIAGSLFFAFANAEEMPEEELPEWAKRKEYRPTTESKIREKKKRIKEHRNNNSNIYGGRK